MTVNPAHAYDRIQEIEITPPSAIGNGKCAGPSSVDLKKRQFIDSFFRNIGSDGVVNTVCKIRSVKCRILGDKFSPGQIRVDL